MKKTIEIATTTRVPWNLTFTPETEERYRQYFFSTNLGFTRLSFIAIFLASATYNLITTFAIRSIYENTPIHYFLAICLTLIPIVGFRVTYLKFFENWHQALISLFVLFSFAVVVSFIDVLPDQHKYSAYGSILFLLLVNFGLIRQKFLYGLINGTIGTSIFLAFAYRTDLFPERVFFQITTYFLIFNFGGASVTYILERSHRVAFLAKEALEAERERAENLLLNILPFPIANRLKANQEAIADHIEEASVLFADIVGFSEHTRNTTPTVLVNLLDSIFTDIDAIMEKYNIEKIKTIGDSYMAASGLLDAENDHCARLAMAALEINKYMEKHPSGFSLRIGIHTGPVIAGVIGKKKMIYDLWGDTVNIAARMESHGGAGQIQVSEAAYNKLKNDFELSALRTIDVKGQGPMRVAYLTARARKAAA